MKNSEERVRKQYRESTEKLQEVRAEFDKAAKQCSIEANEKRIAQVKVLIQLYTRFNKTLDMRHCLIIYRTVVVNSRRPKTRHWINCNPRN